MNNRLLRALVLALILGCNAAQPETSGKITVLILTAGHEFKPESFFKMFTDNPEISYTAVAQEKTAEACDREDLFSYNVLVLYDMRSSITEAQKSRFLALFDMGIGVVIMHHAYLSNPMWPEYERIAGGKYIYLDEQIKDGVTSSKVKGNTDIPVTIVAKDHPVTAGLEDFVLTGELYLNMHMTGSVTPLLRTGDELLAWTRMEKNSRVVGMTLGHGPTAYENPNFLKLLAQSIRWAAQR